MHCNDFIFCPRQPADASAVMSLLASLGMTKSLKIPKDDIEACVSLPKRGLSLIVEPEGPQIARIAVEKPPND